LMQPTYPAVSSDPDGIASASSGAISDCWDVSYLIRNRR
jgi:hypothetical protein